MLNIFENNPFMLDYALGFHQFPLVNLCRSKKEAFKNTVKRFSHHSVPCDANIILSHTIYEIKTNAVMVDIKNLYNFLSSQRNVSRKSMRVDVSTIGFYFKSSVDTFGLIQASANPADPVTKLNSALFWHVIFHACVRID